MAKNKNFLIQALRENEAAKGKKADDYFECNASVVSYSTGFPVLDYYLGYRVNVFNKKNEFVQSYPSLGITAGSFVMFIGKPSTSKTSTAISIAANIVRNFDNGTVIHYDLEQSCNYTRIQALTRLPMQEMKDGKYILRQEKTTLEDMKASIMRLYHEKISNPDKYKYKTGKVNEFNEEIELFEPTVIIIDSIATITMTMEDGSSKSIEKLEEIGTQTDRMRLTGEIGRFFNEIMPYIRTANITVIGINQIKVNPQMGLIKQPAQVLGLQMSENIPGGYTPLFLSHILLRFNAVTSEKYTEEEDGWGGFKVKCDIIKSRVSQALRSCYLMYDKTHGIDMVRSTVEYAKDMGLIGGNRNGYYFNNYKDEKFTLRNMPGDFRANTHLYKIMKDEVIPLLDKNLSSISPEEMYVPDEEMNFYDL